MTDDQLADAWESFAEAIRHKPVQREVRRIRNTVRAAEVNESARRNYEMMRNSSNPYVRGIRPGIFGLGITL